MSAGSVGYGYRVDPEIKGKRTIDQGEAQVVRRIFEDYANGVSPRALAATLNAEGVPGPQGRAWIDTTIRGQVDRDTGLLNNEVYIGRIVWNRMSHVRDSKTGKRVARRNSEDEWEVSSDESLRIVDDALWQCVKRQQNAVRTVMARDAHGVPPNRAHRAQHLLSGLVVCGECGSPFAMRDARHYGCSNFRLKATCTNALKVKRADLERLVGDAIRHRWMNEHAMTRVRAEIIAERERIAGSSGEQRAKLVTAIKRKDDQVARIINAITEMGHNPALLAKLKQLQNEARALQGQRDALDAAEPPAPLDITEDVDALIQAAARDIERAISHPSHPDAVRLREMVRGMIERITINRHESGAFAGAMQVAGLVARHSLDAALRMTKAPGLVGAGASLSVVAGPATTLNC